MTTYVLLVIVYMVSVMLNIGLTEVENLKRELLEIWLPWTAMWTVLPIVMLLAQNHMVPKQRHAQWLIPVVSMVCLMVLLIAERSTLFHDNDGDHLAALIPLNAIGVGMVVTFLLRRKSESD